MQFTFYGTCYCVVVIAAAASTLAMQAQDEVTLDRRIIAGLVIAAFFCIFSFTMTLTSMRYIFLNMTNVDMLSFKSKVYQLAVRVPHGTRPTDTFTTVTYPLPKLELGINGEANRRFVHGAARQPIDSRANARDDLATRTFAILRTESGENPWDLGYWRNWKSVMGTNFVDWLLPVRRSPCANHESHESFYPMGHVLADVCARHGLSHEGTDDNAGLEMRQVRR